MKKLILALAAIAAVGAAQAQTDNANASYATGATPHAYVGLGAAIADDKSTDDYRVSPKVFGGYQYNPTWGAEIGYTQFHNDGGYNSNGSYVAGTYTVPLGDRFSAVGKLGVEHSERTNYARVTDRDNGLYGGVGVQYALNEKMAVTADYERYGKDKSSGAKADTYTVGLKYGF